MSKEFTAQKAINRSDSAIAGANIGPSGSGKSTSARKCVDPEIAKPLSSAVGDTSQTTIIPMNIVLDERIPQRHFALQIGTSKFTGKKIDTQIMQQVMDLAIDNDFNYADIEDELDEVWYREILEPEKKTYHLSKLRGIDGMLDQLKASIKPIMDEMAGRDFNSAVQEVKKLQKTKVKNNLIKEAVYETFWIDTSEEAKESLKKWLEEVGERVTTSLTSLVGEDAMHGDIIEYSTTRVETLPYGLDILANLVDPYQPYSLIVENFTLACRPRQELIDEKKFKDIPVRFVLRDTMGLNQSAANPTAIRDSLEIALNRRVDCIILYLSLEEKDEVLAECCRALNESQKKAEQVNVPVYIVFTKADNYLKNLVSKAKDSETVLTQDAYDNAIEDAVVALENRIASFEAKLPKGQIKWVSLINLESDIDPIQKALMNRLPELAERFRPEGIYSLYNEVINSTFEHTLPTDMKQPVSITVKDSSKPAIKISADGNTIVKNIEAIQDKLSRDKSNVNGYLITDTRRIHGRSVIAYWGNLLDGIGYKTNAHVFGNFQINMKGLVAKVLRTEFPAICELYRLQLISTDLQNLEDDELDRLTKVIDPDGAYYEDALPYISPSVTANMSERDRNEQTIHYFFYKFFSDDTRNAAILDRMAYELSINSQEIKEIMRTIYYSDETYDTIIRTMQEKFKELFGSQQFADLIVKVFGEEMTTLANKLFITD